MLPWEKSQIQDCLVKARGPGRILKLFQLEASKGRSPEKGVSSLTPSARLSPHGGKSFQNVRMTHR
jgi:hypothetical protein